MNSHDFFDFKFLSLFDFPRFARIASLTILPEKFPEVCLWFLSSFVVVHFHPDFGECFFIMIILFDDLEIIFLELRNFCADFLDCRLDIFCFLLDYFLQIFKIRSDWMILWNINCERENTVSFKDFHFAFEFDQSFFFMVFFLDSERSCDDCSALELFFDWVFCDEILILDFGRIHFMWGNKKKIYFFQKEFFPNLKRHRFHKLFSILSL